MKRNLKIVYFMAYASVLMPMIASAAGGLEDVITKISKLIELLIPLVIGIAVLMFLWGVVKYVTASEADAQKEARTTMFYGIVVLFVMVSVWGLVNLLGETIGVETLKSGTLAPSAPQLPN